MFYWLLLFRGVIQRIKVGVDVRGSIKLYFCVKVIMFQELIEICNMGSEVEYEINVDILEDMEVNDSGISDVDFFIDYCNIFCDQILFFKFWVFEDI